MFCTNCGTNNSGNGFCVNCGKPLPQQGMAPQGMAPQGMPPQGMPPQGMAPQGMPPQGMPQMRPMRPRSTSKVASEGLPIGKDTQFLWRLFFLIWLGFVSLNYLVSFWNEMRFGIDWGYNAGKYFWNAFSDLVIAGGIIFLLVALAINMSARYLIAEIVLMSIFGLTVLTQLINGTEFVYFLRFLFSQNTLGWLFAWFYIKATK